MDNLARINQALTSKKWKFEFYSNSDCPKSLLEFFKNHLPHLSPESFNERLSLGGFYVNGLSVSENTCLISPCKVEYYEPKFCISEINKVYPAFSENWIVFEDDYFLLVFKPKRLPSLPTKEQKIYNLKKYILEYCKTDIHMPSRLDTSTEGLVLISKNKIMHNYLQQAFEKKYILKRYLLASTASTAWIHKFVCTRITKDNRHPILRRTSEREGKVSITIFSRLTNNQNLNIFLARPLTGRTHQIRLHSAYCTIPILGDNFYGGAPAPQLHLLSYQIGFWHPVTKKFMEITVPQRLIPGWANTELALT